METTDTISFGQLFELQEAEEARLRVTVRPVPGDDEQVTITPVDADGGCGCPSALVIPRAAVASMRLTGDTAMCCGRRLQVVEIEIADGVVASLVTQVHARATQSSAAPPGVPDPLLGARAAALGLRAPFPATLRGERPWSRTTASAWPDLGCLARYYACLVLCGGYEGCANVCYQDYMQCSAAG